MFNTLKRRLAVLMVPVIAVGGLYFAEPVKADEDVKELNENVMSVNSMEFDDTFETQSFSERRRKGDPNDPDFGKQWFHYMIHDEEVWKKSTGKGVTVAVIDNGFNAEHPDLKANVKGTYDATGNNNVGPVSGRYAYQGTHVAGVIGAVKDNGIGGCGVAPDASLYLIKVGDSANTEYMVNALKKCVEIKADVVNISVCGYKDSPELKAAIDEAVNAGCVISAAAGDGQSSNVDYPAAYENVISVGASEETDFSGSAYTNFGDKVDIAAPGGCGEGSELGIYSLDSNGGYFAGYGTALASPMVSATAALVISADKKLLSDHSKKRVEAVRKRILDNEIRARYSRELGTKEAIDGGLDCEGAVKNKFIKRKFYGSREFRMHIGVSGSHEIIAIGKGRSVNIPLIDCKGYEISKKDAKGAYKLNTSANGITLSDTGKLKVDKSVKAGTEFSVTATYDGDSFTKKFKVCEPVTKMGFEENGKIKSKATVTVSDGTLVIADAPWSILNKKIKSYSGKTSSENSTPVDYIEGIGDIKINTSKDQYITYSSVNGIPEEFVAHKGKKYTLTYTSPDGSHRKLKIVIKCK